MKRPQLAKLTRPRLHKAVARERLFALLDEARKHKPAICVIGPPGAGKTTLVASWLDARGIKGIWYQVDPGDADLSTFFYYLSEAARTFARKGQRPLPLLTPEYLQDVEGFSRRFFRELFSRLPKGSALVLDNYQEVVPERKFHQIVAQTVEEVPRGTAMIAISRRDPPDCYARLIANENVALLDYDDLKLTLEEAHAIGGFRQKSTPDEIIYLHERSEGWAAGLVLMLERMRRGGGQPDATPSSLRGIFDYFAAELIDQFDVATQRSLMQTSCLPRMTTAMAVAITGMPKVAALLEDLHRRHLFVDRRAAEEPVYQFHALFRTYLQHRAQAVLSTGEYKETTLHAALLLEKSGRPDEAFALALQVEDISGAAAIVLRHAPLLIGQGRWKVVVEWIEALPREFVASDCWLLHWHGTALIAVNPVGARVLLEDSFKVAEAGGDELCQVQDAAGVIQALILEYIHFRPMDRWIRVLQAKLTDRLRFENPDAELRAQSALLVALAYRKPDDSSVVACAQRLLELLQSEAEVNLRAISAAYLVAYGSTTGPLETGHRALPLLERLLEHPDVTNLTAGWSWFIITHWNICIGNEQRARETAALLEAIGQNNGLPALLRLASIIGCWLELGAGDLDRVKELSDRLDRVMAHDNPYDVASSASIKTHLALNRGQPELATAYVETAVTLYDEAGAYFHRIYSRVQFALNRIMAGDLLAGERWAMDALQMARRTRTGWLEVEAGLALAFVAFETGDLPLGCERMQQALALGKKVDCIWPFKFLRPLASSICALALESGIEVDYVRKVISQIGLRAPSRTIENWPWPIRIRTLGQFHVLLHDKPLVFPRKTPRKSIALLKALIAFGGRNIQAEKLVDALWPDEEGDAGQEALNQALHRLRRILGIADVIRVEDGRLSLDDTLVWTDVRAFTEPLSDKEPKGHAIDPAFGLYRGEFLADEPEADWAVSLRERLRSRFIHQVEQAGMELESSNHWHEAIALYLRGMDADSLSEAFYQGLMRCYMKLGNRAEALSVYRRLRQHLSIVLGMLPSASSEALARDLRLQ